MSDENDKAQPGSASSFRPDLRVVKNAYLPEPQDGEPETLGDFSTFIEDHLIDNEVGSSIVDDEPPEYFIESIPDHSPEPSPISQAASDVLKEQIVDAADRLASYNIARIAFEFQDGKHGFLVDPNLVSKVRLENQMGKFQRLLRFLKDGPRIKKELSKEEILSGLVRNGTPLTKAPAKFSLIEGIHFVPKDGTIGLSGVMMYPPNNGGVFDPKEEQQADSKAIIQSLEESIASLRVASETYQLAAKSSSGFMSAVYLLGKADDVKRAYQKYAATAQRMAEFRADQISIGVDTRHLDAAIDAKNLMTPALIKNKTSSWKSFASSFVQYGNLVEKMIDAAARPEHEKPHLGAMDVDPVEVDQGAAPSEQPKEGGDIPVATEPAESLEKIHLLGLDYYVKKDARFIEMAKTEVGIKPPPGYKFAHPEIPILWALFRDAYPDRFGGSDGKLSGNDPRSSIASHIQREIPHFFYIDDRMPDIVDPIERIESYINTLNPALPASKWSPLSPVKSVLDSPKISQMLQSAGVIKSSMMESSKYLSESSKLGLKSTCPYVFDANSKFHNINLGKYTPPTGKKLVHPLLPLLVEHHKHKVDMLIKESGTKKPSPEFLRQIGALDATGKPIDFSSMMYIDEDKGGAGSAYEVFSNFVESAKNIGSSAATAAMPKSYDDDYCLGLPDEIRFQLGVIKNLEADFFDTPSRTTRALNEIQAEISSSPRTDVYNLAFAAQVRGGRENLNNQAGQIPRLPESKSASPASAKFGG